MFGQKKILINYRNIQLGKIKMKFIKQIPHQSARSPKITDDYFDEEALRIKEVGKLYGIDLYYPIVNCIRGNDTKISLDVTQSRKDDFANLSNHLKAIGYKSSIERIVWEGAGWFDSLEVDLNTKK